MTKQELNNSTSKLWKLYNICKQNTGNKYFDCIDNIIKPEFKRIYNSDPELKYFNARSIKILIVLNLSHRIIPFHEFGIKITI